MKVLKAHEFTRSTVGGRKHDWTTLLDGQIRQLESDDMGDSKPRTFAHQLRAQAKKRGKVVRIQMLGEGGEDGEGYTGLIVQALEATPEQKRKWAEAAEANGTPSQAPKVPAKVQGKK